MIYNPRLQYNHALKRARVKRFCENPQRLVGTTWDDYSSGLARVTAVTDGKVTLVTPDLCIITIFLEELLGSLSRLSLCKTMPCIGSVVRRTTSHGDPHYFYVTAYSRGGALGTEVYPSTHTITMNSQLYTRSFASEKWERVPYKEAINIRQALYRSDPDIFRWNVAFPEHPWPVPKLDEDKPMEKQQVEEPTEPLSHKTLAEHLKEDPFAT